MKKYKRPQEVVVCLTCKKEFLKDSSEVKRNKEKGRGIYCSLQCFGKGKKNKKTLEKVRPKDNLLNLNPSNRLDEFSIFRPHLKRAKTRKHDCDLTLEEMKEVWDKQKGICVYSKVKLERADHKKQNNPIYTISLDRINSSKGYTKDNIQFISVAMNRLKNSMTHEQMLEVIDIIKNISIYH